MGVATIEARRVACITALLADDPAGDTASVVRAVQLAFARMAARHRLVATPVVDLGSIAGWDLAARDRAIAEFCDSEVVVVGSPVVKGGVGGRVKLLLDEMPRGTLAGRAAIPVAVGLDGEAAAVTGTLATTLAALDATVLPGVAVAPGADAQEAIGAWRSRHRPLLDETALRQYALQPILA